MEAAVNRGGVGGRSVTREVERSGAEEGGGASSGGGDARVAIGLHASCPGTRARGAGDGQVGVDRKGLERGREANGGR